mmetsp:Transcript_5363/g.5126  ORF Transcript_5363/g.5126 Transcript_5363/m.5126 type:complete len:82 (-) Transcript_5363:71-316(-)
MLVGLRSNKIVDHCIYEMLKPRKETSVAPIRKAYPLNQFHEKKSISFFKSQSDEKSLCLREKRSATKKESVDLLLPSIDLK